VSHLVDHPYLWMSFKKLFFMKEMGTLRKVNPHATIGVTRQLNTDYYSSDSTNWKQCVRARDRLQNIVGYLRLHLYKVKQFRS
jgi:hypothetical protein